MNISIIDKSKENQKGELIVILFEKCNLACQMCYQNHTDDTGIDTVLDKFSTVVSAINSLKSKGKTSTTVNFMGGELFADDVSDSVFEDYKILIHKIQDYSKSIDFPTVMHIASNMVWTKTNRVKDLLDTTGVNLAASYDPSGRFNSDTFEVFKKNLIEFNPYIKQVGTVMTNPSMKKFQSNNVPFFDYIYNNFEVVFDHYTPQGGDFYIDPRRQISNVLMPTDVELRDFHKFMIENWPNCYPFKDMHSKEHQPMSCMSTITINPSTAIDSCATYDVKQEPAIQVITFFGNLSKHKNQWVDDYDCLSCEHMPRCSFGCFINHHTKDLRTQEACWLKEVYDFVDEIDKK
jgi:radical SAM protein with 4Fe4S-binding SPASM domain